MTSNLGHLALAVCSPTSLPFGDQDCKIALAPLARRLVYLLETKIARLPGNLGRNLGPKGKLVDETKIARLFDNLGQIAVLVSRHTVIVAVVVVIQWQK